MIKSLKDTQEMYMEWNQLFLKKEDWQRKTFEMIKSDLISAKDNRFVRYDNTEENHLVMIYGKSQVGKTTLILNMIGLKPDCFSDVYETLRAGVPRGNSSTSTAIIYAKSVNEQYGCALSSLNALSSKDTQYYDKKRMIAHLEKIRQQVENNKVPPNSILFIYIPKNCFIQDSMADSISIMDMPGIESRNHKEDIHVQNLMTKYIPISSVCIIACRSNEIQSLETLVLPNHLEWKRMEHRFILVITHAYNDGTTKQYFRTTPSERTGNFYDYVVDAYAREIRKILGAKNRTEVYPVDVGDTLTRLCNEEIKRDSDRKEIIETKDRVLANLRKSIIDHKGERLKSALMDLDVIIKHYGENEIQHIDEEISVLCSKIDNKNNLINRTDRDIEKLIGEDGEQDELLSEIKELEKVSEQFYSLLYSCVSDFSSQTKQYILKSSLFKCNGNDNYLEDKEQQVLGFMRTTVLASVEQYIQSINRLIRQADIDIIINSAQMQTEADSFILEEQNSIYPPKKGLFSKREKVLLESIEAICVSIEGCINKHLNSYVNNCISEIKKSIIDKRQQRNRISSSIKQEEGKKKKYLSEIKSLEKQIEELKSSKKDIEQKKTQDQKTLAMYLEYAERAYIEQRNNVIQQINESKSADDKLLLILFLGVLDKDYQKVTGGIHENGNQYSISQ